ncbi:MAG: RNase adapter RapZ [Bacteroidota bacterium]|nr:RNase adapter RapZ [Bacteroidota bacterium]
MLTIDLISFGYHRSGMPSDPHGNGGGFVFDARCLPNPGREARFRHGSGLDEDVRNYLETRSETAVFLSHAIAMVEHAARLYDARGFAHLQVAFGCTGGQHRSVFCVEYAARMLRLRGYDCKVAHSERERWQ